MRTYAPRLAALALLLAVMTGCKKDPKHDNTVSPIKFSFDLDQLFVLELVGDSLVLDNLVGEESLERDFRDVANHNQLLLYTDPNTKNILRVGVTAPAASYGESSYERVRATGDHLNIRLPSFSIKLLKDNGTTVQLSISTFEITPGGDPPADGVLHDDFKLFTSGTFSVRRGDTQYGGDFSAQWRGHPKTTPPHPLILPPAGGLVTGAFNVYFDEPVLIRSLRERLHLRNEEGEPMDIDVHPIPSDIKDFSTHIVLKSRDLLPFGTRLSMAVGVDFTNLNGAQMERALVEIVETPQPPPFVQEAGHDFNAGRTDSEYTLHGTAELVDRFRGITPYRGRLLKITPPPAGQRAVAAFSTRLQVSADASHLTLRVMKIASTRDHETPSLRFLVAYPNGLIWRQMQAPTDVPQRQFEHEGREYFRTEWLHKSLDLVGQRGQEVTVIIEAEPLKPTMKPEMKPVFLVDLLHTVWEGEDPNVIRGDSRPTGPLSSD